METWDAMCSRRNVRAFDDRSLSEEDLTRILEAGRRSPSARNWQPWDFVAVTDRERLAALGAMRTGAAHVADAAAAVAIVIPVLKDPDRHGLALFDSGQTTTAMQIAAADAGIGSGHALVTDQGLARRILSLPEDREVACLIDFGYPSDRPLAPLRHLDRRPFDEIVHRERW